MFVGQRACFELVLSSNSFREVEDSGRLPYLSWAYEVLGYWQGLLRTYAEHGVAHSGRGEKLDAKNGSPDIRLPQHERRSSNPRCFVARM